MRPRRESSEVWREIQSKLYIFNKEEVLDKAKWDVINLYNNIIHNKKVDKSQSPIVEAMLKEKAKYKISSNMDYINVMYIDFYDFIEKAGKKYIQIYASIYFYDDVKNNRFGNYEQDKCWNDIWIVTYEISEDNIQQNLNCQNCGAVMTYNKINHILKCGYCGGIQKFNTGHKDWKIVDIEVNH